MTQEPPGDREQREAEARYQMDIDRASWNFGRGCSGCTWPTVLLVAAVGVSLTFALL